MRTLCPNFDREDGLETVLEVPMPEELFSSDNNKTGAWKSVKSSLLRSPPDTRSSLSSLFGGREAQIQMLLGVMGASLIPLPTSDDHHNVLDHPISKLIKNQSIEAAMAKYIVKQYTAAIGGEMALSNVESMYAMGKVKMSVTEFSAAKTVMGKRKKKILRLRNVNNGNNGGEMGGFVLWKKGFNQWSLELVVSGCKVSAGCDGNTTWRQNPWLSKACNKPSGPLRRFLQGLDPKTTANMFTESVCIGEKTVNGEECFVLKAETQSLTFKYTVLGSFSQRSGLLIQLEDTYQVKIKNGVMEEEEEDGILWETRTETLIEDYRSVEGILIAHRGRTRVSLLRVDECCERNSKTVMEESWEIEEVGFNVKGLCSDFFMSPGDLCNKEDEESEFCFGGYNSPMLPLKGNGGSWKVKSSKVIALEDFGEFEGY